MKNTYPKILQNFIEQLNSLPTIGRKNAERIALHFMYSQENIIGNFQLLLSQLETSIDKCPVCFSFVDKDVSCDICNDHNRNQEIICVVENFKDILLFEKTLEYNGLYHVLEGKLSPLDGITPDHLRIQALVARIHNNSNIGEIILATSLDTEGDATAFYIKQILKEYPVKVTRLAKGLPFGVDLEYADTMSLATSLKNREVIV